MATREQIYTRQLQELGIYEPAFDPVLKTLAQLERRLTRVQKAWSATVPAGCKPSFLDPLYNVITQLESQILVYRQQLGLTPQALRKMRGITAQHGPSAQDEISARLDQLLASCETYTGPVLVTGTDDGGGTHG